MLASLKAAMTVVAAEAVREGVERETEAGAAADRAVAMMADAERAFDRHRRRAFAPETGALHAAALLRTQAHRVEADRALAAAASDRASSQARWAQAQAEERAVADVIARLERRARRRGEEALLSASANLAGLRRWRA